MRSHMKTRNELFAPVPALGWKCEKEIGHLFRAAPRHTSTPGDTLLAEELDTKNPDGTGLFE